MTANEARVPPSPRADAGNRFEHTHVAHSTHPALDSTASADVGVGLGGDFSRLTLTLLLTRLDTSRNKYWAKFDRQRSGVHNFKSRAIRANRAI